MTDRVRPILPDGIVAVVKRDCPTCGLVAPVLAALVHRKVAKCSELLPP